MGLATSPSEGVRSSALSACRLVVRSQERPAEVLQFILEGLEVGQQVVTLADPNYLQNLAHALSQGGQQPQTLLRNGRLIFLTAPDCLQELSKRDKPWQRVALRRQGPMLRWVSDWSWSYSNGRPHSVTLEWQHRVHECVRSLEALSLCTVQCGAFERRALLAVLADHRQAARGRA
jgi:hypothetical protein